MLSGGDRWSQESVPAVTQWTLKQSSCSTVLSDLGDTVHQQLRT